MPRLTDESLLESFRMLSHCEMCGHLRMVDMKLDPHHLISRGAGGPDITENLLGVCRFCHNRMHNGTIPNRAVLCVIACRLGKTPEEVQQRVWEVMREN